MAEKSTREKDLGEVRAIRDENERRARSHNRVEVHEEVASGKGEPVEIHAVGGRLYLNSHGEAVLDQDGIIDLRKKLDAAFQAVS